MAIYHFLLYFIRPKDNSILYFAILCFFVAWRVVNTDEIYLMNLFPHLTFEWKSKLEYLSTFVISPFIASYLHELFPKELSKRKVLFIHSYIWTKVILTLLLPTAIFSYFLFPYYAFLLFTITAFVWTLALAIRRKRKGSWIFLGGIIFLSITVINDILHSAVVINTFYTAPWGFFIFFFSQASLLAKRSSEAFVQVEILTDELKGINRELEIRVESRTQELAKVNTHLSLNNEQLAESNSVKDKLFSIIAHDLRAPLNSLKAVLELLGYEQINPDETKKIVLKLSENVNYTANLLDNLLFWASSQLKGIQAQPTEFPIAEVLQENIDLLKDAALQKQIQIHCRAEDTIDIWADKNMVRLVLRNLLSNAIKFSPREGQIYLTAQASASACEVRIQDQGKGIEPAIQEKLFQVTDAKIRYGTANEKGTGLGLVLCKEFIEKNEGSIGFESIENQGTTFTVSLPLARLQSQ
jgi:signal transduction histidine kinase